MIAWIATALRRLRDERASALGVAGLVLATALIAAAAPRLLAHLADSTLRSTVADAAPVLRNIQFVRDDRLGTNDPTPLAAVEALGKRLTDSLPPGVAALVASSGWTISTGRWTVEPPSGNPATVRLQVQPDAMSRLTLKEGRWPTGATTTSPDLASETVPQPEVVTFEVALSAATARALQRQVGDVISLSSDPSDPLVGRSPRDAIGARIVGLFQVDDPQDPWWLSDTSLAEPAIRSLGGDSRITDAAALLSPDAYGPYLAAATPYLVDYTFHDYVDPARLRSAAVDPLLVELKRLESTYPPTVKPFLQDTFQATAMREGLRQLIETYRARWASALAVLTIGAIGPASVAIGALGLVIGLAAQRRRSSLALARGRGASLGQIVVAVVAESLLLAVPGAILAFIAALVLVPADPVIPSLAAAGAVVVTTVLLLVIATLPATRGPAYGSGREVAPPTRPTSRRLVLEGLVVAIAVVGAALLRERGLRGASTVGQLSGADPLVAAVPALVGLAAGLVAVRLFPYPMRALAWLARRRRDLVPMLAMRRATDSRRVGPSLIVLMVTAAIWAFSSSVLIYLDRASDVVAWHNVGADYRIQSGTGSIPSTFDPTTVAGVEDVAIAHLAAVNLGAQHISAELVALDTSDYDRVTAGTPAALALPLDLYAATADTISIVISRTIADRSGGLKIGDQANVSVGGASFPMRVAAIVDDLPGLGGGIQFVIASRAQMLALRPSVALDPTIMFVRAPPAAADAIGQAARAVMAAAAIIDSRAAETDAIRISPTTTAVVAGITAAAGVAFVYAVLALAAGLALAGAAEAVEVAHLRTLGLSGRQVAGLVVVEHGPVVGTAFVAGIALGLATFVLLRPGLGFESLIGSSVDVPIVPDPGQLAAVLGGIVAVVVLGLVVGTVMQRGAAPMAALRRGFE